MARILIIDDDVEMADNLATILRKSGYEVSALYTTDAAVQLISQNPPDLLILDVMFPENPVAGFDLARQIRRIRKIKTLPIVLLTNVNQEFPMDFSASDIDPEWMPVQAFLEKPAAPQRLLAAIEPLLPAVRKGQA
jgi:DNA-binding response OmpR family regulator